MVYLDYAATTPVDKKVFKSMQPFLLRQFGNPSEMHSLGLGARRAIEYSRQVVADLLQSKPTEIIFTGSATESINLGLKGLIEALYQGQKGEKKMHLITTLIEHKAVLETCAHLEKLGWVEVTYLPVDKFGMVKIEDLQKAVRPETVLVSVMYVNNEVGTIQPIPEIGRLLKTINHKRKTNHQSTVYFHTDATQAVRYLDTRVGALGVDLLSFSGHKLGAPKGVGVLYVRTGVPLIRQLDGGGQERNFRSGTENVPYIVALGQAVTQINTSKEQITKISRLRDKLITGVLKIPGVTLTGHPRNRAPHLASFIVKGAEGEAMMLLLSDKKIIVSTGSACTSQSLQPSHVLSAMGIPDELSHGSLRFSLDKNTTEEEIDYCLGILPKIIQKLRDMAPQLA